MGKGVFTRIVRMDQFIYCTIWDWIYDSTVYRRYMAPPEVFMLETWRLEISASAYGKLDAANLVCSRMANHAASHVVISRVSELH